MGNPKPVRVLQVIGTLGMGGAETWLMEVLRHWSKHGGGQMDFLLTSGQRGIFDDEAERLGARLYYVRYGRGNLRTFIRQFRKILRRGQYDAIHDHADYAGGWHFLLGLGLLPPVRVAHVHNPWMHISTNYAVGYSRRLITAVGKRLVEWLATDIHGTSAEILRLYGFHAGRGPRVSALHCGIGVEKFNAPREQDRESVLREFSMPRDVRLVLFAGRLDAALAFDHPQNHKNSWFALNVVRAAAEKDPSVRLLMAGAGDAEALRGAIHGWGMDGKLHVIGVREDIPRLMRAADILLFPSRQEGLGMVVVEAHAAGLPVLASTAVPREAVVIPSLYEALPLDASISRWADVLLEMMGRPRAAMEYCRGTVEASAFSIANSSRNLLRTYRGEGGDT